MQLKNNTYKSWVEISKGALLSNSNNFKKVLGKNTKVAFVVKANAYGHGLAQVVSVLKGRGSFFAVDNIDEAFGIREVDKKAKVLILGLTMQANFKRTISNNFSFVVYSLDTLRKIVNLKLNKTANVHIKIETGLNRQGVKGKDLVSMLEYINKHKNKVNLEGVYTHFADVEDTLNSSFAENQLKHFVDSLKIIESKGFKPPLIHAAASAATLLFKDAHFTLARIGIGIYGLWPSRETKIAVMAKRLKVNLKPVLTWKSVIAQVKDVQKGESVGYGRTWLSSRKSKIAVIPIGYSDGFDRKLSNSDRVIIGNAFAPVVGRVAMNMIMVDVTDVKNVNEGSEVVIIGKRGDLSIKVEEIADKIGTINYEVVARINPLLPRILVK